MQAIRVVRRRFIITIICLVGSVIAIAWGTLYWYSETTLSSPAQISEINESSENNPALAEYMQQQKDYQAHFVNLATDIKAQEARRVTQAVAVTSLALIVLGSIAAIIVARRLIRPVEEAYASQERFIQDAAHELRNPLAALSVALQQAPSTEKRTALFKTFQRQTRRLISINEDLLFLERRSKRPIEVVNLSELLADVTEELQPMAAANRVKLLVDNEPNLQKTMSASDYVRLTKNVIDNAIKYSPANTKVSIRQQKLKGHIIITISDQGIGIPNKDQKQIGERFFRASNVGTLDGTGLGLAIVRKILNVYGGSFEIESQSGKGTTVHLKLPA